MCGNGDGGAVECVASVSDEHGGADDSLGLGRGVGVWLDAGWDNVGAGEVDWG